MNTMAEDSNKLHILILGKASIENRFVRNLLLHQNNSTSEMIEYPITKCVEFEKYRTKISVTDTPGLMDADYYDSVRVKSNIEYTLKDRHYKAGFHTVVLTFSFPVRWTPEERKNFQLIKDIIGEKNLKAHGVVVITNCRGLFEGEPGDQQETFKKYIEDECKRSNSFGQVLSLVSERVFFLVNERKSDINEKEMKNLIHYVYNMNQSGSSFSLYETSMLLAFTGDTGDQAFEMLYSLACCIMKRISPFLYNTLIRYPDVPEEEIEPDDKEYDMLEDISSVPSKHICDR